jgi:hypothetical protein
MLNLQLARFLANILRTAKLVKNSTSGAVDLRDKEFFIQITPEKGDSVYFLSKVDKKDAKVVFKCLKDAVKESPKSKSSKTV